ncbi:MAG: DUF423 domain-containing protein [Planctomycetota bacterium]|nr:DUF423 domain-containing protein [Planctomycetota bacterium]
MRSPWSAVFLALGCLFAAAEVGLRAWQAHGLETRLSAESLHLFDSARQHQLLAAIGLIVCGLLLRTGAGRLTTIGGFAFLAGITLFCGDVYAAAFREGNLTVGVAPWGGTLTILAWILLGAGALSRGVGGAGTQIRTGG